MGFAVQVAGYGGEVSVGLEDDGPAQIGTGSTGRRGRSVVYWFQMNGAGRQA